MTEPLPSVALLFDEAELGGHLREALAERGVRIAYEGPLAGFSAAQLRQVDPDVLVVNLDDDDDAAFDRLYAMIDGERPRLVFNDAQASRALAGWDRARWARHLAVKVLAGGDTDPPRPAGAVAPELQEAARSDAVPPAPVVRAEESLPVAAPAADVEPADPVHELDADDVEQLLTPPADLEAELAALLAAEALPADTGEVPDADLPAIEVAAFDDPAVEPASGTAPAAADSGAVALSATGDFDLQTDAEVVAAKPPAVPDWSLVDDAAPSPTPAGAAEAAQDEELSRLEKLSAADFLAPDVEPVAPDIEPRLNLELVSMEEAVAPQPWEPHEMLLDDLDGVPHHVVLLGAAADGVEAVGTFLAGVPADSKLTLLLIQHFGAQPVADVLARLAAQSSLPVRLVANGDRARGGEVLLAPADSIVQVRRDGSVELRATDAAIVPVPPIDAAFSMAANAFGREALGIVFAGASTDAVAGAQAIHDRGGQVWVETSSGEHFDDMVGALFAERLVSHSGTPQELAAHLAEVYA
ncbi:MAG TPA: chemotaxis protein CheB [Rhodanobacter sp.]|nr:chemotaxis protein CheB [Rhodanobacter sp.]